MLTFVFFISICSTNPFPAEMPCYYDEQHSSYHHLSPLPLQSNVKLCKGKLIFDHLSADGLCKLEQCYWFHCSVITKSIKIIIIIIIFLELGY